MRTLPHDSAVAHGFKQGHLIRAQVAFDPETVEQIRFLARRDEINFSAAVRLLVEWGLEAVKMESDDA